MGLEMIGVLRKEKGITLEELSEKSKVPVSTIKKISAGITTDPNLSTVQAIALALGCSIDDLSDVSNFGEFFSIEEKQLVKKYRSLDDHGKEALKSILAVELKRIAELQTARSAPTPDPESEENIIRFPMPFYLQPSSAGFGDWADSEYAEKVMLVKEPPFGAAFIIPVNGDSMEPTYPDGCKVFVRPQHEVREGQVGIFYMDGKLWIKELGSDALISHNPDYPPQPFQEDLRCWGLVVGICDDSYFEH